MEALKYMYEPGEHATVKILPLKIPQNFLRAHAKMVPKHHLGLENLVFSCELRAPKPRNAQNLNILYHFTG